jgi:hypothetical protein
MTAHADIVTRALRFPMPFRLDAVGLEFLPRAKRKLVYAMDCAAEPAFLFDAFAEMEDGRAWMGGFLAMDADRRGEGEVFEEAFTFMRLRGRSLVFERPGRWTARIEAASLPLATRMIEDVEIFGVAGGKTRVRWTFYFDPHPLALPIEPIVSRVFGQLFTRSLARLGRFAETRASS